MNIKILAATTLIATAVVAVHYWNNAPNHLATHASLPNQKDDLLSIEKIPFDTVIDTLSFQEQMHESVESGTNSVNMLQANTAHPADLRIAIDRLSNSDNSEESFEVKLTLLNLKPKYGDIVESAIMDALFSEQIDVRTGMDTIEIVGVESAALKGELLDWIVQLNDDTKKLGMVGVFGELDFDNNQQMQVAGIIEAWQQSENEKLRSAIAAIAVNIDIVRPFVLATALQDVSPQVRHAVLSSMKNSDKVWPELTPFILALSDDESQPSEIRRISAQLR